MAVRKKIDEEITVESETTEQSISETETEIIREQEPIKAADDNIVSPATHTKEQLINSAWYSHKRDILAALLNEDKVYTLADVDRLIENFLKEKVK